MSARLVWRKSSYSDNGSDCVEVAFLGNAVAARDSKDPDGAVLIFRSEQWKAFVTRLNR